MIALPMSSSVPLEKSEFVRLALKDAGKEPEVLVFEEIPEPAVAADCRRICH